MTLTESKLIIFEVGPVPCCVDSNSVRIVIEPPPHITAIPGSNSYRPGLFAYNKHPVAVYDVRTKFNLPTTNRGKIIITEMNQRLYGFWVDRIQDVIAASQGRWQALPAECPKELFSGVLLYETQLIFKTDFNALAKAQVNTQLQRFINQFITSSQNAVTTDQEKIKDDMQKITPARPSVPEVEVKLNSIVANTKTKTSSNYRLASAAPEKLMAADSGRPANTSAPIARTITTSRASNITSRNTTPAERRPAPVKIKPPLKVQTTSEKSGMNKPELTIQRHFDQTTGNQNTSHRPVNTSAITTDINPLASTPKETGITIRTATADQQVSASKTSPAQTSSSGILWTGLFFVLLVSGFGYALFPTDIFQPKEKANLSRNMQPDHNPVQNDQLITQTNTVQTTPVLPPVINDSENVPTRTTEPDHAVYFDASPPVTLQDAELSTKNNDITITLHDPDARFNEQSVAMQAPIASPDTPETAATPDVQNNTVPDSRVTAIPTTNKTATQPDPDITSSETETRPITEQKIVHVVVKGDTLWHIAKHYIHDPFKYHTLAKLSKIRNPDLIYPGNKVTIIIKK